MNEEDLRKNLATAFLLLKEKQEEISGLRNEVAALRDTLAGASPRFQEMFSERLKYWQNAGRALHAETLAQFDEMILKLRDDGKGA